MIITIQTEDGTLQYDVSKITDSNTRVQAKTLISKVGTLDVVSEAFMMARGCVGLLSTYSNVSAAVVYLSPGNFNYTTFWFWCGNQYSI